MTCSFRDKTSGRNTYVNLTTSFDAVPAGDTDGHSSAPRWLVATDRWKRASLWWGESLLSNYWIGLVYTMAGNSSCNNETITKGILSFSQLRNGTTLNVLDPEFLSLSWRLILASGTVHWAGTNAVMYAANLTDGEACPTTWWLPAEKLAKYLVDFANESK